MKRPELVWTEVQPAVSGWYWYKTQFLRPRIIKVWLANGRVSHDYQELFWRTDKVRAVQESFAGPISEPATQKTKTRLERPLPFLFRKTKI